MTKIFKLPAFTFAETLLTLMIIGVVATMTIFPLKNHADEQKFIAYTQKAYTDVSEATARIETKYAESEFWDTSSIDAIKKYYSSVLDTVPFTDTSWNSSFINGDDAGSKTYDFKTNNGFAWSINKVSYNSKDVVSVTVDVNGKNEPNVIGIDIHNFYILKDKIQPESSCTGYILKVNKMPWLKNTMESCPSN